MKKRILSLLLISIMLLTMLPVTALAAGEAPELKMHLAGDNGEVLSSLDGQPYENWTAQFYLHNGTDETLIPPESLTLPDFLKLESTDEEGFSCLKATGAGTGSISCTDPADSATYTMPVTISLPNLGIYTGTPCDADSLAENITIAPGSSVYYIALSPDLASSGYKMTQVHSEFGPEISHPNIMTIGTVELSGDGTYATVTVTDLTAEGSYHFEATVENSNDVSAGTWGRTVWISNDMPRLYHCDLIREENSWTVNYNDVFSDWWCSPGSGRPACFYFGSRSDIKAGKCEPLSMADLSFPPYMKVSEITDENRTVPANALDVYTFRFANEGESTDIIYTSNNTEYRESARPQLKNIAFYTQPAASESAYIYDGNPFVVTEENRTFYVCANAPARYRLTGIAWDDPDLAGLFTVVPDENGAWLEITVKDGVIVPNGWFRAEISYQFSRDGSSWNDGSTGAGVFLENGLPALMYRRLVWNNETQAWYEPEERPLETGLSLSSGDRFPVQFCYGTGEANTKVTLSDLDFPTGILQGYTQDGVAWVKGIGFEESGTITYAKDGVTAAMNVNVTQPEFGLYSSAVAGKDTYLCDEVTVGGPADVFYIVARQDCAIPGIEAIRNDQTGEDATGKFTVDIAGDGSYAAIRMNADDLPSGGSYTVSVRQDGWTLFLPFKLIRGDLPQLSTPTDLTWHRQYQWEAQTATDYEDRMGAMSFKVGELVQNRFLVEIYSAADGYTSPAASGGWRMGDMDHSAYFTVTDFIYRELPSGTYKFRIRAEGDGTKYRDSEWSDLSPAWTYTVPSAQLSAPDAAGFDWVQDDAHYLSTWQHTGETGTGYYEINWYYKDGDEYRHASAGNFDIGVWDAGAGSVFNAMLPDELLEEHGNVNVYFCVRAIPADITQYRISEWSDFSRPLDVNNITKTVNQKLDDLLDDNTSSDPLTVEDVQTALKDDTADLHTAMAADLELSGGPSSGALEKIRELENAVSDTVNQEVEVKNSAPQQIKEIAEGITMIGATLNLADKNPGTGTTPTVTLELDEPKKGIVIDKQQHNAVQFSMKLNGAIDKDDKEQSGQQLIVPVVIDMPVPAEINPDFLVVLHKLWDGSIEQIRPCIYWNETDGRVHARFVIDSFSDFALVEYNFRFDTDAVSKQVGDQPFIIPAIGHAEGSIVTYFSSDPTVAEVDRETGRVTIQKTGTVTITAIASATEVYPEAQARYDLTVTAPGAFDPAPIVPPADQIQIEQPQNGKVSLSYDSAAKGTDVTVTVSPDEGYVLESLTVTDQNGSTVQLTDKGNGAFVFTAPGGKVTVKAVFAPVRFPFTDVNEDSYCFEAVRWALANNITDGTGDGTTFSPNASCTRGQAVTFLWRAAGCPEPESSVNPFTDVKEGTYYYKAVLWAVENGITDGTGDGTTFSPNTTCTRGQIVTFLWRAAGKTAAAGKLSFTDVSADAYYGPAVQWAAENGITDGTGDGTTFSPNASCTRGQIVTFLYRCLGDK